MVSWGSTMQHTACIKLPQNEMKNTNPGCYEIISMFQGILAILSVASTEGDGLTGVIDIFDDDDEKHNIVENVMPFDLPNNISNILLDLFEKSVNSREEKDNLIFSELVEKAKKYAISSKIDHIDKDKFIPKQYRNIKVTVDKNGQIKVPNLFKVKDRPDQIPLIKQYLIRRQEERLIQRQNVTTESKPEVVEAVVRKIEYRPEDTKEEDSNSFYMETQKLELEKVFDVTNSPKLEEPVQLTEKENREKKKSTQRGYSF